MIKKIFCLLASELLAVQVQAASPISSNINNIVALTAGPAWYQAGKTQSIRLQPNFENTYSAHQSTQTLVSSELFLGLGRDFQDKGFGEIGIALAVTNSAQLQGRIWETGDPQFDNYDYQYRIKHQHAAAKAKWLCSNWTKFFFPYLTASIGVAQNTAYHFTQTPLLYEALPIAGFQNRTLTALTYALGAGIDKQLNTHWHAGVGYQVNSWGKSALGRTPTQTTSSGLQLSNLYTQQLEFTLSYLL